MNRYRVLSQGVALLLVLSLVNTSRGAPADVAQMAAPMLGADPPAAKALRDGDASVSTQTGALQYSYPITVPPGRLGNQPNLALSYSSQAPIYGGIAAGWSLSIPEIQRDTSKGILEQIGGFGPSPATRTFLSTMAGSRPLIEVGEPAEPEVVATFRAQNDASYTRYQRMQEGHPFAWRAYATDGLTYYFGDRYLIDATASIDVDRTPLTRTVDPFGNTVEYVWRLAMEGGYDIAQIRYTSNAQVRMPAFATVDFDWDEAPPCTALGGNGARSYRSGEIEETGVRTLRRISAVAFDPSNGTTLHTRQIDLHYDDAGCDKPHALHRQLTSLQERAWGPAAPLVELPPVVFTYGDASRTDWEWADHGPWTADGNGGSLSWGRRYDTRVWPTVEAMLVDLDGDGLVDRLRASYDDETCRVQWDRNTGYGFAPTSSFALPHLPWVIETPQSGCSLSGQLTHYTNVNHNACASNGVYLSYRWLDMNGDGLPELVTAIHHDANHYDPTLEGDEPFGKIPPLPGTGACLLLDEDCMVSANKACHDDPFCFDPETVKICTDARQPVPCYQGARCDGALLDPVACEGGEHADDRKCDAVLQPHEVNGLYPWMIYENLGNGEIAKDPVIKLNPVPLESDTGDSPSGAGAFTSSWHAITDLDGDGLLDAVLRPLWNQQEGIPPPVVGTMWWFVFKGDGTGGFTGDSNGAPFIWYAPAGARPSAGGGTNHSPLTMERTMTSAAGLADFNGDGLQDYYWKKDKGSKLGIYWNLGRRFWGVPEYLGVDELSKTYVDPELLGLDDFMAVGQTDKKTLLLDYDDDGRADLLSSSRDVNNGTWSTPVLSFSDGIGFSGEYKPNADEQAALRQGSSAYMAAYLFFWETTQDFIDIDGDGSAEHIDVAGNVLRKLRNPVDGKPARLLTRVDSGQGAHVDIRYAPLTDNSVVTTAPELRKASPQTKWVVASLTSTDDFEASPSTTTYRYLYPVWSPDDENAWGFRGFEAVRTTNSRGAVTEERYDYAVDWSGRLKTSLTYPKEQNPAGLLHPTTISETQWDRYTLFDDAIETFHPTISRTFTCDRDLFLGQWQTELSCRNDPAAMVREETVWTAYGSAGLPQLHAASGRYLQDSDQYDQGDRRTVSTYALTSDASTYRLRPTGTRSYWLDGSAEREFARTETLWDPSNRVALEERTYFDATSFAATVSSYWMTTGNVRTVTKPEQVAGSGRFTEYGYDSRGLFATSITNELGHTVQSTFDYGTGAALRTMGPRSISCTAPCLALAEARTDVDGLGRPIAAWVSRAAATGYQLVKVSEVIYADIPTGSTATSVTTKQLIDYDSTRWTQDTVWLDGHGRPIQSITYGGSAPAQTTYDYDIAGKLIAVSLPNPAPNGGQVTYTYSYDSIGRPTAMRRPDGSAQTASGTNLAYVGLVHTRTEVAGAAGGPVATAELVHDAFGRLAVVREKRDATEFAETFYEYDPRDIVTGLEDPEGVTTSLIHDWGGRRTAIVRESRTWRYTYDRNGNVSSETAPFTSGSEAQHTTTYAYDDLDRVTSKVVAPRSLSQADRDLFGIGQTTYGYDDGPANVGYLASVTLPNDPGTASPVLRTAFAYDAEGNVVEERRAYSIAGRIGARRIKTTCGPGGKPVTVDYGDGPQTDVVATQARFTYDDRDLPSRVDVAFGVNAPMQLLALLKRNVAGNVIERSWGGGRAIPQRSTWTYDGLGRITAQQVKIGGGVVAEQALTYWGTDDPKTLAHTGSGLSTRNFSYAYDARHQLTSVSTSQGSFASTYAFTVGGRLDHATVAAAAAAGSDVRDRDVRYEYQAADPEMLSALRRADGSAFATYSYDAPGNVVTRTQADSATSSTTTSYVYDGEDLLRRATVDGLGAEEYFYDHDGMRFALAKRGPTGQLAEIRYFQGPLEIWLDPAAAANDAPLKTLAHISQGTPLARVENGTLNGLEFQYHSTLQSLLVTISPRSAITSSFAYGPYGEVLQTSGTQLPSHRRRYNDKYKDELTGLSYYGYRYYDPIAQTWTSADPAFRTAPDSAWDHPRLASLYLFDLSNPMRYVDPDGRCPACVPIAVGIGLGLILEGGNQLLTGDFDLGRMANAGTAGGVAAVTYLAGAGGGGAVAAGMSTMIGGHTERMLNGGGSTPAEAASDFLLGAAFHAAAKGLAKLEGLRQSATERLSTRAAEVHAEQTPIAQRMRTTAALQTAEGPVVIGGGKRDLSPAQREALRVGEIPARMPKTHAEATVLQAAEATGLSPVAIAVTRRFCPDCAKMIESAGGTITSSTTAVWNK